MLDAVTPAACLQGLPLCDGWVVTRHLKKPPGKSGGVFSESYIVSRGNQRGFLKALDFSEAFEPGADTLRMLNLMTSAFEHERDILKICADLRLSNVVVAVAHGDIQVPGRDPMNGKVFYLIFELADGDIRDQVSQAKRFDTYWSLVALKDVCLGLAQVHRQMIAHQDLKPSNVLMYRGAGFRIADFGRSSLKGRQVWYDDSTIAGDQTYSPPELLYGFLHPDFNTRRFGCDLYMLENLVSFMLAGVNVTSSLLTRLDPQFRPTFWRGTYNQVLPYLQLSFGELLSDLRNVIDPAVQEQAVALVSELCNPDLSKRGHPKRIGQPDQQSLERYVSLFDLLCRRFAVKSRVMAKLA